MNPIHSLMRLLEGLAIRALWSPYDRPDPDRDFWIGLREREEREIGAVFAETLLPRLPGGLAGLTDLRPVEKGRRVFYERDLSVLAAGLAGITLARVGLTPVKIAGAAFCISCIVDNAGGDGRPLTLSCVPDRDGDIPRDKVVEQLSLYCEIQPDLATALAAWVIGAAGTVTGLIPDYRAERKGDLIVLTRDDREYAPRAGWRL